MAIALEVQLVASLAAYQFPVGMNVLLQVSRHRAADSAQVESSAGIMAGMSTKHALLGIEGSSN